MFNRKKNKSKRTDAASVKLAERTLLRWAVTPGTVACEHLTHDPGGPNEEIVFGPDQPLNAFLFLNSLDCMDCARENARVLHDPDHPLIPCTACGRPLGTDWPRMSMVELCPGVFVTMLVHAECDIDEAAA